MSELSPKSRKVRQTSVKCVLDHHSEPSSDNPESQGLIASLITKIINNLQVTVRNIHIRYEDKLSVPGVSEFIELSLRATMLIVACSTPSLRVSRWLVLLLSP